MRSKQNQSTEHSKARKIVAGSALVVSLAAAGIGGAAAERQFGASHEISVSKPDMTAADVIRIAQQVEQAGKVAEFRAQDMERAFKAGQSYNGPLIANGVITYTGTDGITRPSYKDVFVLSTLDPAAKPDASGDFLEGGYYGIQGHDAQGDVTITPIPYVEENGFVPADPNELVFDGAAVYATSAHKGGPNTPDYDQLIVFDPSGERQILNTDGSMITPGESVGMK